MKKTTTLLLLVILALVSHKSYSQVAFTTSQAKENSIQTKGTATPLPYNETFDTEESLTNWTVQDNNGGSTWTYFTTNNSIAYLFDADQQADDYLVSPTFELDNSFIYKLAYQATIPRTSSYTESFSVVLLNQVSNTTVLADFPEYLDSEEEQKTVHFAIPENGEYRIGFHEYSKADMFRLEIDNVELIEAGSAAAPGSISNYSIIAAEKGQLADTISFTAPSLTWGGQTLSDISYIEIYRNGDDSEPAYSFDAPQPGEDLQWIDTDPSNGVNTYKIFVYNSEGQGPITNLEAFVGVDIPSAVTEAVLTTNSNKEAIITWVAPTTGINNAYINPEEITYRIVKNGSVEISNGINNTTYTDASPIDGTSQAAVNYSIFASTSTGESQESTTNTLIFGDPYASPFNESFKNGEAANSPWSSIWIDGEESAAWSITNIDDNIEVEPQDNDGGMLSFNSYDVTAGAMSRITSPTIDISTLKNPILGFWMYHFDDESGYNDALKVQISADNADFIDLTDTIYMTANNNGWTYYETSLVEYTNSKSVNIGFLGISDYGNNLLIDNIKIYNAATNDLKMVSINGSKRVSINQDEVYTVEILNTGANATNDYTVKFNYLSDSAQIAQGTEIAPNQTATFNFKVNVNINDITIAEDFYNYSAEIEFANDEVSNNNFSDTLHVTVRTPNHPEPQDLISNLVENTVTLSWTEPETRSEPTFETVTEDFESHEAFSISDLENWTLLDLDKDSTQIFIPLGTYKNQGDPMAFQVINIEILGLNDDDVFTANSGNQYLISPAARNVTNNNWLISPMLSTKPQTISFFAKQPTDNFGSERMVIWYSTTDNHPDSFVKLSEGDYIDMPYSFWKNYEFNLPEGAKYFAIQSISEPALLYLCLDDITYEKTDIDPDTIMLKGYNIYRNDTLINSEPITETSYNETLHNGTFHYKVSAVYDKGESIFSNEVEVDVNATSIPALHENAVEIYASKGNIYINNALGKVIHIISLDGKVLNSYHGNVNNTISYKKGVYIIKVNQIVKKVVLQ